MDLVIDFVAKSIDDMCWGEFFVPKIPNMKITKVIKNYG